MNTGDTFQVPTNPGDLPMREATAAKVGFRDLSPAESDLMRRCREEGERLRALLRELEQFEELRGADEGDPVRLGESRRLRALARTHLQDGLMWAVRSITLPAFF